MTKLKHWYDIIASEDKKAFLTAEKKYTRPQLIVFHKHPSDKNRAAVLHMRLVFLQYVIDTKLFELQPGNPYER